MTATVPDFANPAPHAAPGPYLGFALQPVRLCYHLLTAPDDAHASMEYADDVAVAYRDGRQILEQTKSALSHNPLSDWSSDLWKTVSNWLDAIETGRVDPSSTIFQMYVTPSRGGAFSNALHDARTPEAVQALAASIEKKLAHGRPPKTLAFVRRFLSASEATRLALIKNLAILADDDDPLEPIRRLIAPTVAPELVDVICQAAIGFAKEQADKLLRQHQSAVLSAGAFKRAFRAFVQKNNLPGLLVSHTATPTDVIIGVALSGRPRFIQQLELIDAERDEQWRAVSDFLHSSADKTKWAELGLLFERELEDWNRTLQRKHTATRGEVEDLYEDRDPQLRGRLVYRRCCSADMTLEGRVVPDHFVPGSFHALADTMSIGWHPQYAELIESSEG